MLEPFAEVLLERLCTAVQKVQEEFILGGIIKDGEAINQLCHSVDDIFSHGLKEGILNWASGSDPTYWPLVVKITYKEVIQDIISHTSLKSDREKCQVWIRVAAQENSLGSYLNIVTQDDKLLREFYHPHAFVFDEVKVDTAKTALLYGLSHLDFNISLDIPHQTRTRNVHNEKYSLASSATVIPDKSLDTANGYHFSYSSSTSYPGSFTQSPHKSLTKPKKKKKIKSSVAEIADSLDEGNGNRLTYMRYMASTLSDSNCENELQNGSQHDVDANMDSLSNIRLARTISNEFEKTNNEGIDNALNNNEIESENCKDLPKRLGNLCLGSEDSIAEDVHQEEEENQNEFNVNLAPNKRLSKDSCVSPEYLSETDIANMRSNDFVTDRTATAGTPEGSLKDMSIKTAGLCGYTIETETATQTNDARNEEEERVNRACETPKEIIDNTINHSDHLAVDEENLSTRENKTFDCGFTEIKDEFDYKVSCVRYEFGTPTDASFNEETAQQPEQDQDLNFVPGIHKENDWRSRSSSINSFTGSGSFTQPKQVTEKTQRTPTTDSSKPFSASGRLQDGSRRLMDSESASDKRKDSRADETSVATEDSFSDLGIFEELLGMDEDHFATPEDFMGFTTSETLEHAIRSCKDMIKTAPPNSLEKKQLIERLVHLKVKLQDNKEESSFVKVPDAKKILGHQFVKEQGARTTASTLCDRCGKWIWTMWQSLFICKGCSFCSHRKCLDLIRRPCASRKVSVSTYNLNISPECGLNAQQYKCVECRKRISLNKGEHSEARLCDYSGQFFCEDCHWNDQVLIPARIIHNWDFTPQKVSRQTKQFLDLMMKRPMLDLEQQNPALFKFVGELREIKRLREEILVMKKYFMSCRKALESKLLLQLQDHQHFVENSNIYSLQDILEVERGTMLPFTTRVHSLFLTHIKSDCELCRAKGFVCEICKAHEIIFAFDPHAVQCEKCRTVLHKSCFKKDSCPKCLRIQKRIAK